MYATCLFCQASLGCNASVEAFPVGRRLAFDAAKGRLWVVCRACERWNLTPLEERWEAIEQCERLFRDTRLKTSTDQIGMATLREGLELVRIGAPRRPELAAWRYGDQFGRRRNRRLRWLGFGAAAVGVGIAVLGGAVVAATPLVLVFGPRLFGQGPIGEPAPLVTALRVGGEVVPLRRDQLGLVTIRGSAHEGWSLGLPRDGRPSMHLWGDAARRALGTVLPHLNHAGGSREAIGEAVRRIEEMGDAEGYVRGAVSRGTYWGIGGAEGYPIGYFEHPDLLALEMALHEESERRAMEGELAQLEQRWREAEEIAAIADDLLLPASIGERLSRLRGR